MNIVMIIYLIDEFLIDLHIYDYMYFIDLYMEILIFLINSCLDTDGLFYLFTFTHITGV